MTADGRFAPSPTGPLHLGSLRTALVAWLMARSQGARFVVRIEDLDPQRSRPELIDAQLTDLSALGIDWDGEPVRQSERTELYAQALRRLQAQGRVYPCFCTRAEIREAASAPHGEAASAPHAETASVPHAETASAPHGETASAPHGEAATEPHGRLPEGFYPGTCARLSDAEARRRVQAGERHALRLRAGGERVEFVDRWLGSLGSVVDDFVLVRSDGVHAYQLAVVVDDAQQGIGEVVRGADLAQSTPRQILLQRLLNLPSPRYAHVGLVLSADGRRLAKRDRGVTLADRGESTEVTLAWLAHSLGLAQSQARLSSASELLGGFRPELISATPITVA